MALSPSPGGVLVGCTGASSTGDYYLDLGMCFGRGGTSTEDFEMSDWFQDLHEQQQQPATPFHKPVQTTKVKNILQPLRVNRQMYEEAVATLYSTNVFVCDSLPMLNWMLTRTRPCRRQYIRHIAVAYIPHREDMDVAAKTFQLLSEQTQLRTIQLHINEAVFLNASSRWHFTNRTFSLPKQIPGIATLRTLRFKGKLELSETCPTIKAMLKADSEDPNAPRTVQEVIRQSNRQLRERQRAEASVSPRP